MDNNDKPPNLDAFGKTIGVDEIAALLRKTPDTVRNDITRRPESIPPRLLIPGRLLWLERDVIDWINQHREAANGSR